MTDLVAVLSFLIREIFPVGVVAVAFFLGYASASSAVS